MILEITLLTTPYRRVAVINTDDYLAAKITQDPIGTWKDPQYNRKTIFSNLEMRALIKDVESRGYSVRIKEEAAMRFEEDFWQKTNGVELR